MLQFSFFSNEFEVSIKLKDKDLALKTDKAPPPPPTQVGPKNEAGHGRSPRANASEICFLPNSAVPGVICWASL